MIRYTADVIVIGAGIAGVTAAIELLDRGRSVLLLDRDAEENMGGLAKESFGGIWFAGTPLQKRYGIRDGVEQGLRDWHAFAEFGPEDDWPRAWAEAYVQRANAEIFDWLRGIGVRLHAHAAVGRARPARSRQLRAALAHRLGHGIRAAGGPEQAPAGPPEPRPPAVALRTSSRSAAS